MSFQEVDLVNLFLKCYKAIENFKSAGYWYRRCGQYSGCQTIHNLIRQKKGTAVFANFMMIIIF